MTISEKRNRHWSLSRSETLWFPIVMRRRVCDQGGTKSGGAAATQARRAAADEGGGGRVGRWARAAVPALGVEAGGATMRQLAERPLAAAMVMDG